MKTIEILQYSTKVFKVKILKTVIYNQTINSWNFTLFFLWYNKSTSPFLSCHIRYVYNLYKRHNQERVRNFQFSLVSKLLLFIKIVVYIFFIYECYVYTVYAVSWQSGRPATRATLARHR